MYFATLVCPISMPSLLDELPRSDNIEDRRGRGGGFPGGRSGAIIVLGIIGWLLGIDPRILIGGADVVSKMGHSQQQSDTTKTGLPSDQTGQFVSAVLGSTEAQWTDIFSKAGKTYTGPTLVMFSGSTSSACGFAESAMGPF